MDETVNDQQPGGISRRSAMKRIGAGAAIAWSAPALMTMSSKAFGGSVAPHPECAAASCGNFVPCTTLNPDCICVAIAEGGGSCVPGSTSCNIGPTCATTADCPAGDTCFVNTCCGAGVCAPGTITQQCPPSGTHTGQVRKPTGPGTFGG